ncbi:MAG: hypothetical protein AAF443_05600 [Chlamydiota bacterium]
MTRYMRIKCLFFTCLQIFAKLSCSFQVIGWVAAWLVLIGSLVGVEVVPVKPTPEEKDVTLRLIFPQPYENKRKTPINIQLRLQGLALGIVSPFSRANEIYNSPDGQGLHVIIDDRPYFTYSHPSGMRASSEDQLLSFSVPFTLASGMHVIRCFPVRSYGESLKGKNCFKAEIFYFQDRKRLDTLPFDRFKPYLTYNEPQGSYPAHRSDPILLDFYLSNCSLSANGYKVKLFIDGREHSMLTSWVPYYIKGLSSGKHTIRLELLDERGQVVPGSFNVAEREIVIEPPSSSSTSTKS